MAISNIGPSWTLGDRLAKARREAGIQAQEMADIFGVSRNSISAWEHDTVEVKASTVARWAEVTNVSVAWLLTHEYNGDEPAPRRGQVAGTAVVAPIHTADADEATKDGERGRVSGKISPSLFVTSTQRNGSKDPCSKTNCVVHHVEPGDRAAA